MTADELVVHYLETGALDDDALAALPADDRAALLAALPELDRLRASLQAEDGWVDPPAGLEDAVVAAVLAGSASAPAPDDVADGVSGPVPMAAPPLPPASRPSPPPPPGAVASLAEARARRSRVVAIGASAVAAAAIIVAIIGFARPTTPDQRALGPTSVTPTPVTLLDEGISLKASPTDFFPNASGTARLQETSSGVRIHLNATGLPRRENGEFYEAWVKTERGLVPIGTFHTGDDVVLWAGVATKDIQSITVTLEENDGNQESSGKRALVIVMPTSNEPGTVGTTPGSTPGTSPGSTRSTTSGSTPGTSPGSTPGTAKASPGSTGSSSPATRR